MSGARFTIAVLPGDGIGPEVVAQGRRVLSAAGELAGAHIAFTEGLIGGAAIDATANPLPNDTIELCRAADAVLLGAVGGPKWDNPSATVRPEQGLLAIRRALGLFANLRPVLPHPSLVDASPLKADRLAGVDLIIVRELTGGIYFGDKGVEALASGGERAHDLCVYETHEIERIVRAGAELARARRGRLTSVDKANVLETSRLWRRVTTRVMAEEFPDVALDHLLVDSCAMHLVTNPARFDVIVTENMFGDILTDEAAVLTGSIGVLPSASLGSIRDVVIPSEVEGSARVIPSNVERVPATAGAAPRTRVGLYEPIHGSAPDLAGRGMANPLGTILSVAMLLRHSLGLETAAQIVERAVWEAVASGARTPDLGGCATTITATDAVLSRMESRALSS